jgi:hypothetical protein
MKTIITLLFIIAFSITGKSQAYYYTGVVNGRSFTISGYSSYSVYSSYSRVQGSIPGYGKKKGERLLRKFMETDEFKVAMAKQNKGLDSVTIRRKQFILDSLANKKLLSN